MTCSVKELFIYLFFSAELEFTTKAYFLRGKKDIETRASYCQKNILQEKLVHRQVVS